MLHIDPKPDECLEEFKESAIKYLRNLGYFISEPDAPTAHMHDTLESDLCCGERLAAFAVVGVTDADEIVSIQPSAVSVKSGNLTAGMRDLASRIDIDRDSFERVEMAEPQQQDNN